MFDTFQNRLTVEGYLVAESGLHVGVGRAGELVGTELPVVRDTRDCPFSMAANMGSRQRA